MLKSINSFFTQYVNAPDLARLLLRITLSVLMLFHGFYKVEHGLDPIRNMLVSDGLPTFIAYGVYLGEVVAPIMIILGIFTRPAALIVTLNMLIAILMMGLNKVTILTDQGALGIELEFIYFIGFLCIALLGCGRFSVLREPAYY